MFKRKEIKKSYQRKLLYIKLEIAVVSSFTYMLLN